ncbi:hypothetical protein [Burkholderia ubonensis]|uniref:hypothetical protein n=1 Tax=Burkholderia ubonensis TaxID=101571 RepID=UPI0012F9E619|nr:hypothetical protein [Burkholderia ubonensis]
MFKRIGAPLLREIGDASRCSEAQLWCDAALSTCGNTVHASGEWRTRLRHRAGAHPRGRHARPVAMRGGVQCATRRVQRLARILLKGRKTSAMAPMRGTRNTRARRR